MELVASSSANALRQTARLDDKHRGEEKEGRSAAHILSVCPYILHYGTLDVLNVLNSRLLRLRLPYYKRLSHADRNALNGEARQ